MEDNERLEEIIGTADAYRNSWLDFYMESRRNLPTEAELRRERLADGLTMGAIVAGVMLMLLPVIWLYFYALGRLLTSA